MHRVLTRTNGTLLAMIGLALLAALACGAASSEGGQQGGTGPPIEPSTYDPQLSISPLVKQVAPAVVNIKTSHKLRVPGMGATDGLFEWFFGPHSPGSPFQPPRDREIERRSVGSGFIVDGTGLVVTNHHVVEGADQIRVQLSDESSFDADLVGSDKRTDVALLRLADAEGLPTVEWGNSERLEVGDWVVAIGNPFGLDTTVTSGIVSAKERVIGAGPYDDFIQTDASINPGNSGGPLFNLRGEVVGINTAIAPHGQGIGFAIPSNLAQGVIDDLRGRGRVVRGWLGVLFQPLDDELAHAFGLDDKHGAVVTNVSAGSPAAKAGMMTGDVIVEVSGERLESGRHLPSMVASLDPGAEARIAVVRDGVRRELQVEIGEMPNDPSELSSVRPKAKQPEHGSTRLGFTVIELDDSLRKRLGAKDVEHGVVVVRVEPGSLTGRALEKGDVIVEVNRDAVRSVEELEQRAGQLDTGDDMLLLVHRDGTWLYVVIRL
ncbi:MAG: Do family serine endopeptidase [Deltaproteobacteria bacterium]|nr:Do family serine endopeptidase [Deltaproteobacteria bacterium]